MMEAGRERYVVLLVEDDPDHATLVCRALECAMAGVEVTWARDGADALDYLLRRGRYLDAVSARRPDLILVDVNMPRLGGHDLLRTVKADPALRAIPVVMVTTGGDDAVVRMSYALGANSFVTKPIHFAQFGSVIASIGRYWMGTNVRARA